MFTTSTHEHYLSVCPNCGYCPHCGRGGPVHPTWPATPWWSLPFTYTTTTGVVDATSEPSSVEEGTS